jgi:PAS domain S-box-containing protein
MSEAGRAFDNELMREALNVSRVGMCVLDEQHVVILLNRQFSERLGLRGGSGIGRPIREVFSGPILVDRLQELLSLDSGEVAAECRLRAEDGSDAILLLQARTLDRGADGRYRILTLIDITDFGITRDNYLMLRRQLDALNTAVVVVDVSTQAQPIVYVNRRFEQITGYRADEVIGRNCNFLQGDDTRQPEIETLRQAVRMRQSCHVVLRNYRKDGTAFQNELLISPIADERGEVNHFIGLQRELKGRSAPDGGWIAKG